MILRRKTQSVISPNMFTIRVFSTLVCLLLSFHITASPSRAIPSSYSEPLPPSQDPFYTAPEGFEHKAPGTILRIRHAPGNATTVIANSSAVYNIVYRTTDSNYKPSFSVTTLFVPLQNLSSSTNTSHTSLLSIQVAYNSVWVDASPSYSIYYDYAQPLYADANQTNLPLDNYR